MIERYFTQPAVLRRIRDGLMSPYLDALAAELEAQHYSRKSIRRQLGNADAFGRWLVEQAIPFVDITEAVVARYIDPMHRCPGPSRAKGYRAHKARGLPRLIELLRSQGAMPTQVAAAPSSPGGTEELLEVFDGHLERVAGFAASTRKNCRGFARGLLRAIFGENDPDFTQLRAEDVAAFIQIRAEKRAPTCRKDPGYGVLVFLRFLSAAGLVPSHLQYAIPHVRQWAHAALPRFLATEDLDRVLALPADPTPKGLRDRAMLLLLSRLGLRAAEVVRLQLDDIDWRAGNLLIRAGKTRRERILPLPQDVGESLVAYLKHGRPKASTHRRIFLNLCPPHEPLESSVVLTKMARTVLQQADVHSSRPGAYVFRHTIATHMVWRGTTFKEIADVLGHQSLVSTTIYAKLDFPSLAQVASVWPGGAE
jgi:site-specific recombinase XerD